MIGKYKIEIESNKIKYEFEIKRNITIIRGDSATGKTELLRLIGEYFDLEEESGISLRCEKVCRVLQGRDWKEKLENINDSIVFIDEINTFTKSEEFAKAIKDTDNYYVIVTRNNLENLPYSVDEIYGIRESGKYKGLKKTYNELYKLYENESSIDQSLLDYVIVEDSNSGYEFFKDAFKELNLSVISAFGKSNIQKELIKLKNENLDNRIYVIADGAAFGSQIDRIVRYTKEKGNIFLFLPESFEWLILISGVLKDSEIDQVLAAPWKYIESKKYFSWERYFTDFLAKKTENSYFEYNKKKLNKVYLHDRNRNKIMELVKKSFVGN